MESGSGGTDNQPKILGPGQGWWHIPIILETLDAEAE